MPNRDIPRQGRAELTMTHMTPAQLVSAMRKLGVIWGLPRPLRPDELGVALRLTSRSPDDTVRNWLRGKSYISGPVSICVETWCKGVLPPDPLHTFLRPELGPMRELDDPEAAPPAR